MWSFCVKLWTNNHFWIAWKSFFWRKLPRWSKTPRAKAREVAREREAPYPGWMCKVLLCWVFFCDFCIKIFWPLWRSRINWSKLGLNRYIGMLLCIWFSFSKKVGANMFHPKRNDQSPRQDFGFGPSHWPLGRKDTPAKEEEAVSLDRRAEIWGMFWRSVEVQNVGVVWVWEVSMWLFKGRGQEVNKCTPANQASEEISNTRQNRCFRWDLENPQRFGSPSFGIFDIFIFDIFIFGIIYMICDFMCNCKKNC